MGGPLSMIVCLLILFEFISTVLSGDCQSLNCTLGEYLSCDLECVTCPAGCYCPFDDTKHECAAGEYNPLTGSFDSGDCLPCPPGTYSSETGSVNCTLCEPGNWCGGGGGSPTICLNGFYADRYGLASCIECPSGHECPDKTLPPVACDVGKYALAQKMSCSSCLDSQYTFTKGSDSCLPCEAGFMCVAGIRSKCPLGKYSSDGAVDCDDCNPGEYTLTNGSEACLPCPVGFECPTDSGPPVPCPVGSVSSGGSVLSCSACVAPSYSPLPGSSSCILCPPGTECVGNVDDPSLCSLGEYSDEGGTCLPCPEGKFCLDPTSTPVDCPPGTFALGDAVRTECSSCLPGYYQTSNGSSSCLPCSQGYFCDDASKTSLPCPAGTFSAAMSTNCTPCTEGETSAAGESTCTECPAGSYCPRSDLDPIPCPEGFISTGTRNIRCSPCSVSTYSDVLRTSCLPCDVGFQCGNPLIGRVACEAGYVALTPSKIVCDPCPAGFVCPTADTQVPCGSGFYSYAGWTSCLPCPEAMNCTNQSHPVACPDGQFSAAGVEGCLPCPAGSSCHQGVVVTCPSGYYSLVDDVNCHLCEPGFSCLNPDEMLPCDNTPGNAEWSPAGSTTCNPCPAGFKCPSTKHAPIVCPEGTYALADQIDCVECPAQRACADLDSGPTSWCNGAGEFSILGFRQCGTCPPGFFCSSHNSYNADVCPVGTFSLGGLTTCDDCVDGHFCDRPDEAPKPCPEGTYNNVGPVSSCTQCPAGRYCPDPTQAPSNCLAGTWSPLGSIECFPCTEGYVCGALSTGPNDGADTCGNGVFCLEGSTGAVACPPGTYGYSPMLPSASEDRACELCPAGSSCSGGTAIIDCPTGSYCPAGTSDPADFLCPAGTYRDVIRGTSLADCWICLAGSVCLEGTVTPTGCLAGRYCPEGTTHDDQYPCPEGTYSASADATSESTCLPCPSGSFCEEGSTVPVQCPIGTYNPDTGAGNPSRCVPCEPGYACVSLGLSDSTVVPCTGGYYCPRGTSDPSAYPCVAGTFSDASDLHRVEDCEICHQGYSCAAGSISSSMVECAGGYYCLGADSLLFYGEYEGFFTEYPEQYPCPPGYYLNATGSTHLENCTLCPEGSFCRGGEGTVSGDCATGHYCPNGTSSDSQFPCPAGTYTTSTNLPDSDSCTPCPEGSYCPDGSSDHILCPARSYTNVTNTVYEGPSLDPNSESCLICPEGFYCPLGTGDPVGCPVGTFSSSSYSSCRTCYRGTYCPGNTSFSDMISVYRCEAGTYCNYGMETSPDPVDNACPTASYCPEATDLPVPCPRGTFNNGTGLKNSSQCTVCPQGSYCVAGSVVPTGLCDVGYYCPAGSEGPTQVPCPQRTYRNETGARSAADCWTCPSGYTCPIRSVDPSSCPASFYCPVGSFEPVPCALGTFSNATLLSSAEYCTHCPAGQYCNGRGIKSPTGFCDQGFFCISKAWTSKPIDGSTGGLCPRGGYCDAGSSFPTACQPGTYRNLTGGKTVSSCLPCIPGYYCAGSNNVLPTAQCWPGYYCDGGAVNPKQHVTPVGYYTGIGSSQPIACPKGTFANATAMTSCHLCESGFYCPTIGESNGTACPAGHYCPSGSAFPRQCPSGTFSNATELPAESECSACPCGHFCESTGMTVDSGECSSGFFCTGSSNEQSPVEKSFGDLCPEGHYCPSGSCGPQECPAGTYISSLGRSSIADCLDCMAGYYCPHTGMTNSTTFECFAGSYCSGGALNGSQYACPPGHYCPVKSPIGIPCDEGTFANVSGFSECFVCPESFHCPFGTIHPLPCPVGRYCPAGSVTHPLQCPPGTFRNVTGGVVVEDCDLCPGGRFCSVRGLSSPNGLCFPGHYCVLGAMNDLGDVVSGGESGICPEGHYCPLGTTYPEPCPTRTYLDDIGKFEVSHCLLCRAGEYCNDTGLSSPFGDCFPGYYCPVGSGSPTEIECPTGAYCESGSYMPSFCDPGTYQDQTGMSTCKICPSGYYCPMNTTFPLDCPFGYYCPTGTESIRLDIACPEGTFGNVTNLEDADNCTVCTGGSFCAYPGLMEPSGECAAGYYCTSRALDDMGRVVRGGLPSPCPKGSFCPPGSSSPHLCPDGTFSDEIGNTNVSHCLPCTPGTYCGSPGLASPTGNCSGGYYCVRSASVPEPADGHCPLGMFCPQGTVSPIPCPDGMFANETRHSECVVCPPGYYCLLGEDFPLPCPPGRYCHSGSGIRTDACPVGTYYPGTGLSLESECLPCSGGMACTVVGLETPNEICQAGFFCPNGSVNILGEPDGGLCPNGTYCPPGQSRPIDCPVGTFNSLLGSPAMEDCKPCLPGMYCAALGQDSVTAPCHGGFYCPPGQSVPSPPAYECPVGFYCVNGTDDPIGCPYGTFQNETGQPSCVGCPAGYYCLENCSVPLVCPEDHYCPEGVSLPIRCPDGTFGFGIGLSQSSECSPCPNGTYCVAGQVAGDCFAGYWCLSGNREPHPVGDSCPIGFWCDVGELSPNPCPNGTFGTDIGGRDVHICGPCPAGSECLLSGTFDCSPGYYCPFNKPPVRCPVGTVNGLPRATNETWCLPCPAGYLCPTTGIVTATIECPPGSFCPPGSTVPLACPPGTYNSLPKGIGLAASCLPCPPGYYCNETIDEQECVDGAYCMVGSHTPRECPPRYYCPNATAPCVGDPEECVAPVECPAGSFCPRGSEFPVDCIDGYYYCPPATDRSLPCPVGYRMLNSTSRTSLLDVCEACPAGYYGNQNRTLCQICSVGHVCLEAATSPIPTDIVTQRGYECPVGHQCPAGSGVEDPCPAGTFQPDVGMGSCDLCPPNHYIDTEASTFCRVCGSNSRDLPHRRNCECKGFGRTYQKSDGHCLCYPRFVHYEENLRQENKDSAVDCQEIVYLRCARDSVRNAISGECVDPNSCDEFCSGGNTTVSGRIDSSGLCSCERVVNENEVCDSLCRHEQRELVFDVTSQLFRVRNGRTGLIEEEFGSGLISGSIACLEGSECRLHMVEMSTLGIKGLYDVSLDYFSSVINGTSSPVARRSIDVDVSSPGLYQPLICLNYGEALMFHIASREHYPKYMKDSLLNTNGDFDYGEFRRLENAMKSNLSVSTFVFQFLDVDIPGTYVFYDAAAPAKITVVTVMDAEKHCPGSASFVPLTASSLVLLGISDQDSLRLSPDWVLVVALFVSFLLFFLVLVSGLKYLLSDRWTGKETPKAKFRRTLDPVTISKYGLVDLEMEDLYLRKKNEDRNEELVDLEDFHVENFYRLLTNHKMQMTDDIARYGDQFLDIYHEIMEDAALLKSMMVRKYNLQNLTLDVEDHLKGLDRYTEQVLQDSYEFNSDALDRMIGEFKARRIQLSDRSNDVRSGPMDESSEDSRQIRTFNDCRDLAIAECLKMEELLARRMEELRGLDDADEFEAIKAMNGLVVQDVSRSRLRKYLRKMAELRDRLEKRRKLQELKVSSSITKVLKDLLNDALSSMRKKYKLDEGDVDDEDEEIGFDVDDDAGTDIEELLELEYHDDEFGESDEELDFVLRDLETELKSHQKSMKLHHASDLVELENELESGFDDGVRHIDNVLREVRDLVVEDRRKRLEDRLNFGNFSDDEKQQILDKSRTDGEALENAFEAERNRQMESLKARVERKRERKKKLLLDVQKDEIALQQELRRKDRDSVRDMLRRADSSDDVLKCKTALQLKTELRDSRIKAESEFDRSSADRMIDGDEAIEDDEGGMDTDNLVDIVREVQFGELSAATSEDEKATILAHHKVEMERLSDVLDDMKSRSARDLQIRLEEKRKRLVEDATNKTNSRLQQAVDSKDRDVDLVRDAFHARSKFHQSQQESVPEDALAALASAVSVDATVEERVETIAEQMDFEHYLVDKQFDEHVQELEAAADAERQQSLSRIDREERSLVEAMRSKVEKATSRRKMPAAEKSRLLAEYKRATAEVKERFQLQRIAQIDAIQAKLASRKRDQAEIADAQKIQKKIAVLSRQEDELKLAALQVDDSVDIDAVVVPGDDDEDQQRRLHEDHTRELDALKARVVEEEEREISLMKEVFEAEYLEEERRLKIQREDEFVDEDEEEGEVVSSDRRGVMDEFQKNRSALQRKKDEERARLRERFEDKMRKKREELRMKFETEIEDVKRQQRRKEESLRIQSQFDAERRMISEIIVERRVSSIEDAVAAVLAPRHQHELSALEKRHGAELGECAARDPQTVERHRVRQKEERVEMRKRHLSEKNLATEECQKYRYLFDESLQDEERQLASELAEFERQLANEKKEMFELAKKEKQDMRAQLEEELRQEKEQLLSDAEKVKRSLREDQGESHFVDSLVAEVKQEAETQIGSRQSLAREEQELLLAQHQTNFVNFEEILRREKSRQDSMLEGRITDIVELKLRHSQEKATVSLASPHQEKMKARLKGQLSKLRSRKRVAKSLRKPMVATRIVEAIQAKRESVQKEKENAAALRKLTPEERKQRKKIEWIKTIYGKLKTVEGLVERIGDDYLDDTTDFPLPSSVVEPCDAGSLKLLPLVSYQFGLFYVRFLVEEVKIQPVKLALAVRLPHWTCKSNPFRHSFFFDADSRTLHILESRVTSIGHFLLLIMHCLAHIATNSLDKDDHDPDFIDMLHRLSEVTIDDLFHSRLIKKSLPKHIVSTKALLDMRCEEGDIMKRLSGLSRLHLLTSEARMSGTKSPPAMATRKRKRRRRRSSVIRGRSRPRSRDARRRPSQRRNRPEASLAASADRHSQRRRRSRLRRQ